jgi:hypothetical protein
MTPLLTEADLREATGLLARLRLLRSRADWPTPQLKREITDAETRLVALRVEPGTTTWGKPRQPEPVPA